MTPSIGLLHQAESFETQLADFGLSRLGTA